MNFHVPIESSNQFISTNELKTDNLCAQNIINIINKTINKRTSRPILINNLSAQSYEADNNSEITMVNEHPIQKAFLHVIWSDGHERT